MSAPIIREYIGEVATLDNVMVRHQIIKVNAITSRDAFQKISRKMDRSQGIVQISRAFSDCSLPQPVYDFFNQYSLVIENQHEFETWAEVVA